MIRTANLKKLIAKLGSQEKLAEALDVSPGYISQMSNGTRPITEKTARKYEKKLGFEEYWFDNARADYRVGENSIEVKKISDHSTSDSLEAYSLQPVSNIIEGPESKGQVPLISWVQAGDWCEAIDLFEVGDAERWLPCPVNHSDKTFILRVQGASMEPEYRDGDLIFVDPSVQAEHNSDVIVRLENANTATFKRLQIVGDKSYLSPINRDWPEPVIPVNEHAQICGVVIFSGRLR